MHLLIVDDETHVVDRLEKTVPWQKAGIDHIYCAYSAREALALMQQCPADIVVTDIRMPGMSGLELIAEIRRRWNRTKCVLLSGYSDFHYAKEAIRQQVEEYLLKPVTEEELLQTVSRLCRKIAQEWEEVCSLRTLTRTLADNLPLLKANLLNELLQGCAWGEQQLREKMAALSLPDLYGRPCAVMLIRLEEPFINDDFRSFSLIEYAVCNIAEELFRDQFDLWQAKDAHDYLIFVAASKQGSDPDSSALRFEQTAVKLQAVAQSLLKGRISVIVSDFGLFPRELPAKYDNCVSAARKRVASRQSLFLRTEGEPAAAAVQSIRSLYEPPTLIHLLEAGRWGELEEKLACIMRELEDNRPQSQEHLLEVYFAVSSAFTYIAHKNGQPLSELIGKDYEKLASGIPPRSISQLRNWCGHILQRLKEDTDRENRDSRTALIRDIHRFIEANLSRDVTLQSIADHVHMHPVYISKIYKLETGENISEHIHKLRMEKAVYALANSQEKTYEIAEKLGYQRSHSFIHAFKKHYGLTPQEYRERLTKASFASEARAPR